MILLTVVALHIAVVLFYLLVKKDNLHVPMITGHKPAAMPDECTRNDSIWIAAVQLGCSAALVY